jgi:Domain of unknown function (DUF4926)
MNPFTEHSRVVLTEDLSEYGLLAGKVGTLIHVHRNPLGYELEFFSPDGKTLAVVSVHPHQVRAFSHREKAHA